jgi:hypothetical protein
VCAPLRRPPAGGTRAAAPMWRPGAPPTARAGKRLGR